jgi:hypothetical protein
MAASLIAALVASPIAADTISRDRTEFDRAQGSFEFSEGGRDFSGQILVQRDTETGASIASFFFYSVIDVMCDNGTPEDPDDDFLSGDLIDFTANEALPATLSIESNLSAASASATASGQRLHIEACTEAETSTTETVSWQMALQATGPAARATEVNRFPNEDGTVETQSIKIAQRPAAGTIAIDGTTLSLQGASISHTLIVTTIR